MVHFCVFLQESVPPVNLADLDNLLYVQISGVDAFTESDISFTILH